MSAVPILQGQAKGLQRAGIAGSLGPRCTFTIPRVARPLPTPQLKSNTRSSQRSRRAKTMAMTGERPGATEWRT
jgi:hypothetical protein